MSPEQGPAGQEAVDKRKRHLGLWRGCCTRCSRAARPFAGETVSDVPGRGCSRRRVDLGKLPESAPPAIRRLLRRCLERESESGGCTTSPTRRIVLEDVRLRKSNGEATAAATGAPWWRLDPAERPLPGGSPRLRRHGGGRGPRGLPREGARHGAGRADAARHPARAQSGARDEGNSTNRLSRPDRQQPRLLGTRGREAEASSAAGWGGRGAVPIPGTEGGDKPLSFLARRAGGSASWAESQMRKVPAEGGRPFFAWAGGAGSGRASAWLPDDTIVYAPIYSEGPLPRAGGGAESPEAADHPRPRRRELGTGGPEPLSRRASGSSSPRFRTPVDRSRIGVLDLATREVRWVVDGGLLRSLRFPPDTSCTRRDRGSTPCRSIRGRDRRGSGGGPWSTTCTPRQTSGYAQVAVSSRGTLAYVTESLGNPLRELVWIDRTGRAVGGPRATLRRFLSGQPLARRPAGRAHDPGREPAILWTLSLERGTLVAPDERRRHRVRPRVDPRPGKELLYVVDPPALRAAPDRGRRPGLGPAALGRAGEARHQPRRRLTPTGARSRSRAPRKNGRQPLREGPSTAASRRRRSAPAAADERCASFSPDARFVVYQSDETGRPEDLRRGDPGFRRAGPGVLRRWERARVGRQRRDSSTGHDDRGPGRPRLAEPGRLEFDAPRSLFAFPIAAGGSGEFADVRRHARRRARPGRDHSRSQPPAADRDVTGWASELARLAPRGGR